MIEKPYRGGRVHVLARMCDSCIFRPDGLDLDPGRRESMVAGATEANAAIICHSTLNDAQAVCRGFFDKHPTETLNLAVTMRVVEFVVAEGRHP